MSEQLKYKMYDHEVVPPERVWNAIVEELGEEHSYAAVAEKISSYEVTPPAASWQMIANALDTAPAGQQSIPVRSLPSRRPVKWMAAAALILFLAGGYYLFNNGDDDGGDRIASAGGVVNTDQPRQPAVTKNADIRPAPVTPRATPSYFASNIIRKKKSGRDEERPLRCSHIEQSEPVAEDLTVSVTPHQILGESGEPIRDMSIVNPDNKKYISITAPNGQQTRISSKLAIAMPYFGIANQVSQGLQTENGNWKQLVQEWRNKIMHSGFIPSSSNFLDILEFSDLIKE